MTASKGRAPPRSPLIHSDVYGVHGTKGTTGWKAFYTRTELESLTEAVEWAVLPPGAVSGEHRHTRTEEIYLILNGEGEYFLNGQPYPVKSGALALMTPGNTHGLRNSGMRRLDWLVIETLTPQTDAILTGRTPPRNLAMLPQIVDLTVTPRFEASGVFEGPLSVVQRHVLAAGFDISIEYAGHETACFLNKGSAILRSSEIERPLHAPIAFLIPLGEPVTLEADSDIELYTISLRVSTK